MGPLGEESEREVAAEASSVRPSVRRPTCPRFFPCRKKRGKQKGRGKDILSPSLSPRMVRTADRKEGGHTAHRPSSAYREEEEEEEAMHAAFSNRKWCEQVPFPSPSEQQQPSSSSFLCAYTHSLLFCSEDPYEMDWKVGGGAFQLFTSLTHSPFSPPSKKEAIQTHYTHLVWFEKKVPHLQMGYWVVALKRERVEGGKATPARLRQRRPSRESESRTEDKAEGREEERKRPLPPPSRPHATSHSISFPSPFPPFFTSHDSKPEKEGGIKAGLLEVDTDAPFLHKGPLSSNCDERGLVKALPHKKMHQSGD